MRKLQATMSCRETCSPGLTGDIAGMHFLRAHITTATVTIVAVAAFLFPAAADLMDLKPDLVSQGQVWRLITAHLTHCELSHLFWDVLVFAILGAWAERQLGSRRLACLLFSVSAVLGVTLWRLLPEHMASYRGLSGVDCVLVVLLSLHLIATLKGRLRIVPVLALMGLVAKTCLEGSNGRAIFADDHLMEVVPLAHWGGAALGALAFPFAFGLAQTISNRDEPLENI